MNKQAYILLIISLLAALSAAGQNKTSRDHMRTGNKAWRDSSYVEAETNYRKAIDKDAESADARYNLAGSLLMQNKVKDAVAEYESTIKIEKDKNKKAEAYHNIGFIMQGMKQYQQAVAAYREAMKLNPHDDETRYNLALAQKLLKDQQQKQQNQDQQKKDQKDDKKNENKKDQKDQKKKQENKQNKKDQKNKKDEMSKQNAEQLLKSVMQDEKDVRNRMKKAVRTRGQKRDKDW